MQKVALKVLGEVGSVDLDEFAAFSHTVVHKHGTEVAHGGTYIRCCGVVDGDAAIDGRTCLRPSGVAGEYRGAAVEVELQFVGATHAEVLNGSLTRDVNADSPCAVIAVGVGIDIVPDGKVVVLVVVGIAAACHEHISVNVGYDEVVAYVGRAFVESIDGISLFVDCLAVGTIRSTQGIDIIAAVVGIVKSHYIIMLIATHSEDDLVAILQVGSVGNQSEHIGCESADIRTAVFCANTDGIDIDAVLGAVNPETNLSALHLR